MQRLILTIISIIILSWLAAGGPIYIHKVQPLSASPDITTFNSDFEDKTIPTEEAQDMNAVAEVRQIYINLDQSYQRIKNAPCDKEAIKAMANAIEALITYKTTHKNFPKDYLESDIREDGEVAFDRVIQNRYLQKSDFSLTKRFIVPVLKKRQTQCP